MPPRPRSLGEVSSLQAQLGMLHPAVGGVCVVGAGRTKM